MVGLERIAKAKGRPAPSGGNAAAEAQPKARPVSDISDKDLHAVIADRIAIYNPLGDVVSVM